MRTPGWTVVWLLLPAAAHAHAPLARSASVSDHGDAIVRMPGFGVVLRSANGSPRYACDALLGLDATDQATSLAARDDGSFLLGAPTRPLRIVSADGCAWTVAGGWPATVGVGAIARVDDASDVYFAVSAESSPAVYRSVDRGETWRLQSRLDAGTAVTAMRITQAATGPAHVLISRATDALRTLLLVSTDDGITFAPTDVAGSVTLVHARAGNPDQVWLIAAHPESGDVAVLRGAASETTFETVHRVRFFGGIAIDEPTNTVWIADEAGALARSTDGGDSFSPVNTTLAVACLIYAGARLWACTAGTNHERALAVSDDLGATFTDVFAFAQVQELVTCPSAVMSEQVCSSAWSEWQRDVLDISPPDAGSDAGVAPDAARGPRRSASCAVGMNGRAHAWWILIAAYVSRVASRRRRTRDGTAATARAS